MPVSSQRPVEIKLDAISKRTKLRSRFQPDLSDFIRMSATIYGHAGLLKTNYTSCITPIYKYSTYGTMIFLPTILNVLAST